MFPGGTAAFPSGYAPGTQLKMSCSPSTGAMPPYSSTPNPYSAVYAGRNQYPQQNLYTQALLPSQQLGPYYPQPLYAAPPHVIHHTTVVQPNGLPAGVYAPQAPQAPQAPPPRAMGLVPGTTMAMSAGTFLTAHSTSPGAPHPAGMPTYRHPSAPTYSYVPPQW